MRIDIELWTKHFNNFHLGKKCPKASLSLADIAGSPGEGHPFKQVDLTQVQLGQLNIFENNSTYFGMPLMLMSPFQEQSISIVTVSKHEGTLKGSWKLNLKDKFIVVQTKQKIQPKAFGNTCLVFFFFILCVFHELCVDSCVSGEHWGPNLTCWRWWSSSVKPLALALLLPVHRHFLCYVRGFVGWDCVLSLESSPQPSMLAGTFVVSNESRGK